MPTLNEAFQEFMLDRRAFRNVRPKSIEDYHTKIRPFLSQFGETDVAALTKRDLRHYFGELSARPKIGKNHGTDRLSQASIAAYFRAIRAFINFCTDEYDLPTNPMKGVTVKARGQRLPKAATLSEALRALASIDTSTLKGKRDRAILAVLMDTGMRVGGLCSMTLDRLTFQPDGSALAIVTEKGQREHRADIGPKAAAILKEWLSARPPAPNDAVFCAVTIGGRARAVYPPLTEGGVSQALKTMKRKLGIKGRFNPHSFRHLFGSVSILNGNDLSSVSQLMGHSDVSVTSSFYMVFDEEELTKRKRRFSPLRDGDAIA
jgi:site-specific recombinase XerD